MHSHGQVETALQELFESVLGVAPVDVTEDFFNLGGHSLSFIKLCARVRRRFGVDIASDELLQVPSCRAMARLIIERTVGEAAGRAIGATIEGPVAVTATDAAREALLPASERPRCDDAEGLAMLYGHWSRRRRVTEFGHALLARLQGPIDPHALAKALTRSVSGGESLLAVSQLPDGSVVRKRFEGAWEADVVFVSPGADIEAHLAAPLGEPWDLEEGPLVRAMLVARKDVTVVLLSCHAAVARAWTPSALLGAAWRDYLSDARRSATLELPSAAPCAARCGPAESSGRRGGLAIVAPWCVLAGDVVREHQPGPAWVARRSVPIGPDVQRSARACAERQATSVPCVLLAAFALALMERTALPKLAFLADMPRGEPLAPNILEASSTRIVQLALVERTSADVFIGACRQALALAPEVSVAEALAAFSRSQPPTPGVRLALPVVLCVERVKARSEGVGIALERCVSGGALAELVVAIGLSDAEWSFDVQFQRSRFRPSYVDALVASLSRWVVLLEEGAALTPITAQS
ncbi:MAG TPA: phosphopantetheine-binding protein [Polyangiaceae bacterium]|nr:phosphopantetheine-binding protein [Polyangiaceae bacterium]